MFKKDYLEQERRKYIRLDTVFPVEFRILSADGRVFLSDWLQGFTSTIGKGGICLEVNNLSPQLAQKLKNQQVKLALKIEMPITKNSVSAKARVAWMRDVFSQANRYLIGLSYEEIQPHQNNRIMHYAWTKKLFAPVTIGIIIMLGLSFIIGSYLNVRLIKGNKVLVEQLVEISQETSVTKQEVKKINREKEELQLKIQALEGRIQNAEEEKVKIEQLLNEKASLEEQLIGLKRKENAFTEELSRLDKKKAMLTQENFDNMYKWLLIHQNPRTGLVMSFEGDKEIADWAFTYDQSLVAQAYINFGDFERARKILDFFMGKAKRQEANFFNAYYVNDGSPSEYTVHSGPNIWLGIAALHYIQKTQDCAYLSLAEEIAEATMSLQNQDKDGGIRGGPDMEWYSTEHNLDAYAFFNMLYKITGKVQYLKAGDKLVNWLVQHTYDKTDIPVRRGKGDSTIATDTYAWSVAALGPVKLEELGMNPDRIVEFAEQNCVVEVLYTRPGGQVIKIKGFDFAPQRHVSRGGVVSSEWTAQMALAFKIMADFYHKKGMITKGRAYEMKADEYLAELGNMIISSPSPSGQGQSCLPYATQDFVDTGHGWMTPKGQSTGSVAGTTYALFAYYNYNPLELKENE
jgi:hypothetical protein